MSQNDQPKASTGIITSDAVQGSKLHLGRVGWLAVALVGLALLASGVYFGMKYSSVLFKKAPSSKQTTTVTPAQAVSNAQAALKQATTPKEKAVAYEKLGTAYMDNNQTAEAITSYQSAASGDSGDASSQATVLSELAGAYFKDGNIPKEIATLQQLVGLLQQSKDPTQQALVPKYQRLITELQGIQGQ